MTAAGHQQRLAGLYADTPEIEFDAHGRQRRADKVMIADRRPAAGDDHIGIARCVERGDQCIEPVRDRADPTGVHR